MPSGGSQRYGMRDPHWFHEPNYQEQAGINPLANWINSLTRGRPNTDMGTNRNRAGNTAPLQSFVRTAGLGAVVNNGADVQRSANQRTKKQWGH